MATEPMTSQRERELMTTVERPTFTPVLRDDGDPEAMFPRSHYTRSQAITETREEWDYRFPHRRDELHAVAAAVRYATREDYDRDDFLDIDEHQIGSYLIWCKPDDPGAIPAWMVCPKARP